MTDAEFDSFVAESMEALERKHVELSERFGLGSWARWDYDLNTERLRFSDVNGRCCVEATAIEVGSFSNKSNTWKWAWANQSIPDKSRAKSVRLRELFDTTGFEIFQLEVFEADEQMAWELAAMAVAHLSALGCYQGPSGHLHVFLAIESIRALGAEQQA
jgi:hypothetical protein